MNELIKITYNNDRPAVSARDLHDFLEVKTAYLMLSYAWLHSRAAQNFGQTTDHLHLPQRPA